MPRPITASIRLSALRSNLGRARALAPGSKLWAVVKANAYGHGVLEAASAFSAADGLALVEFDAAARLRQAGWVRPILMLEGAFDPADLQQASEQGLSLVVHDPVQLEWLTAHGGPAIDVFLKLNTGMNRLGVALAQADSFFERLSRCPSVRSVSWMTHFANADVEGGTLIPLGRFDAAVAHRRAPHSLANSAALFDAPATHRHWVRPGIMLYGSSPFADRSAASLGLQPAMVLHSRLLAVQQLEKGDSVGYGSTFTADRAMRIGIVAGGYADGYPRHAPTGTPVAVEGIRTQTLGRVSMDMMAVDLTGIDHAAPGSPVELWGMTIPIDEVAQAAGTIAYELMCGVAPRVRREVISDGVSDQNPVRL